MEQQLKESCPKSKSVRHRHLPMSHPSHPIWKVIRLAIVAFVLAFLLRNNYQNGFDLEKDGKTIVILLSSILGFDIAKQRMTHE